MKNRTRRISQRRNGLLPIRNSQVILHLFLCRFSCQRCINQTLPHAYSLVPKASSGNPSKDLTKTVLTWPHSRLDKLKSPHTLQVRQIRCTREHKHRSAGYAHLTRWVQLENTQRNRHTHTHAQAAPQHSSQQLENDLICTVLTSNSLTSFLFLPLTPNENHMLLTENINFMVMHDSLPHLCTAMQHKCQFRHGSSYFSSPNSIDHRITGVDAWFTAVALSCNYCYQYVFISKESCRINILDACEARR